MSNLSFNGEESFLAFLAVYPFAAFVLDGRNKFGNQDVQLHPVYANTAYYHLIHGPESATVAQPAVPINTALLGELVEVLADTHEARRFVTWLALQKEANNIPGRSLITLSFRPSWISFSDPPLRKVIVATFMGNFCVCTTIPVKDIPAYDPSPPSTVSSLPSQKLPMHDLPPPPATSCITASHSGTASWRDDELCSPTLLLSSNHAGTDPVTSQFSHTTSRAATNVDDSQYSKLLRDPVEMVESAINHPLPKRPGEMARMIESYPWEQTPLGPRSQWSQSLKTAASICIHSPLVCSLWWGPDLVLIYNDQYVDVVGKKHPELFGKPACQGWGNVGSFVKELGSAGLKGKSAASVDDLLFVRRLTSADLPEEVYHTWSSIPVDDERGVVSGVMIWSIETTQKVIAERRLSTLRAFGERAKLSKDAPQLTSALLSVLEQNREE